MEAVIERTTREDQQIAQSSIASIERVSVGLHAASGGIARIKFQETGEYLKIPKKAFDLLSDILHSMAQGRTVTLIPLDSVVSTQQAADMLKVSRPHLVKLLEAGAIPFKKAGIHRRIDLKDLLEYQHKQEHTRKKQLDFLTEQAQELNLGY
jgi:excisionase family DNA binding protein